MSDPWRVLPVNLRPTEFNDILALALTRGVSASDVVRHALGFAPEAEAREPGELRQQLPPLAGRER